MRQKRVMGRRNENFLFDGGGLDNLLFDYNGIYLGHTSVWWVLDWKTADLCVSSNQAKESPICDSYSENKKIKYEHKKKFMTDNKKGNTILPDAERVGASTMQSTGGTGASHFLESEIKKGINMFTNFSSNNTAALKVHKLLRRIFKPNYFGDLLPINCEPEKKNSQVSVWLNCGSVRKLPIGNWVNCGDGVEEQCGKMLASRGGEKLGHGNNLSSVKGKFPPLAITIKAGRHVETVEMRKEITVLASSTQVQGNKQEQEMVEQSSNNLNQIRNQIQDIKNQNGISGQKISELDTSNQALLGKLIGLEKSVGEKMEGFDKTENSLLSEINSLQNDNAQNLAEIRQDLDNKLAENDKNWQVKHDSIRSETNILNQHLEEVRSLHLATNRRIVDNWMLDFLKLV